MENCKKNDKAITGCRVSLYPMMNDFAPLLLKSIDQTHTQAVWAYTDLFSTLYRGESASVVDAAAGIFINAHHPTTHLVGEFTFSHGCPGDTSGEAYLTDKVMTPNRINNLEKGDFNVHCKYSFYVFGRDNYMEEIAHIVSLAKDRGLNPQSAHYVTLLEGSAGQLFKYFDEVLTYAKENLDHFVLQATVSVNSPSLKAVN